MEQRPLLDRPSRVLEVIRNPMIFNAFAVMAALVVLAMVAWADMAGPQLRIAWAVLVFVGLVTLWLNYFAAKNPRFLAYGPREYLEESRLAHERQMASKSERDQE